MPTEEGFLEIRGGHRLWFRRRGAGTRTPLLVLHGGPGASCDYLEPIQALSEERPVVLYDQLGSGRSDHPDDDSLWTIARYAAEVDEVRDALGLDQVHLFGHSWGGWLAIEYMTRAPSPTGIASLVLGSTSSSLRQVASETARLRAELPAEVLATLAKFEAVGDYHAPEYEEAAMEFYRRHVCRLDPWPDYVQRTMQYLSQGRAYEVMQGPNEFTITGNLKDWDRTNALAEIQVPTLIVCGEHDELGAPCATVLRDGIPRASMVVFDECSHTWLAEDPEASLSALSTFFTRVDGEHTMG